MIDIVKKKDIGFVDLKAYGCNSVQEVEYSSVKRYAFVECSGSLSSLIVVDVDRKRVAYWKDGIAANVTGYPVASPDRKYVIVYDTRNMVSFNYPFTSSSLVFLLSLVCLCHLVNRDSSCYTEKVGSL